MADKETALDTPWRLAVAHQATIAGPVCIDSMLLLGIDAPLERGAMTTEATAKKRRMAKVYYFYVTHSMRDGDTLPRALDNADIRRRSMKFRPSATELAR